MTLLQMLHWLVVYHSYFVNAQQQPKNKCASAYAFVTFYQHICFFARRCALEKHTVICFASADSSSFKCFELTQPSLFNVIIHHLVMAHRPKNIKVTSELLVWTRKAPFLVNVCPHVILNIFMVLAGQKSQAKCECTIYAMQERKVHP